jgi:argininosuccinate lyase
MATLKGLPSTYNKDLQEDKEPLFDAFDTLDVVLPVVTAIMLTLKLNPDKMRAALGDEMLATDLADYLVRKGMPFRQAHHIVGTAVRAATEEGVALSQLWADTYRHLSELFDEDVLDVFDFHKSVSLRRAAGGTAPDAVRQQIAIAKDLL